MRIHVFGIGASLVVAAVLVGCLESDEATVVAVNPVTGETRTFETADVVPDGWEVCPGGDCSGLVDEECDVEECGPALGMPNYLCDDGTYGGPTGRCLRNDEGSCGWEIRECLPDDGGECTAEECGPEPMMPNYLCDDGSYGGPTGRCLRNDEGACGWEILECDHDGGDCAEEECGPALGMPACICADGSVGCNTGRCIQFEDGTCGWEIRDCPTDDPEYCADDECPHLEAPACLCADGSIGCNTGRCLRADDGSCVPEFRDCPEDGTEECSSEDCGPELGMPNYLCPDGTYGGPTGRCLRNDDGACGWEVRDCPDDGTEECEPEACGPALGMPAWTCDDGSIGGNTGRCLLNDDGSCGWEIRDCPA